MERPDARTAPPLSPLTKALYASGAVPINVVQRGLSTFLLLFYNQVVGLPPKMVATAIMITLMADAVLGPAIGQLSDNVRSKLGRRHPFMYLAALPTALAYFALWDPPRLQGSGAAYAYLLAALLAVRLFETCFELPSSALLPELTRDYNERTAIVALRTVLGAIGAALMTVLAFQVFLKESPGGGGGVLSRTGYSSYGLASAGVILVFILASAIGTHDRIAFLSVTPRRRLGFMAGAREILATLNNRSFIALTAAGTFCFIALGARGGLEIYFNIYFWGFRQWQLAVLATATIAASLAGAILAPRLSKRFGKKHAVMAVLVASVLTAVAPVALRLVGLMPANGTMLLFGLMFVDLVVNGAMSTTIGVLVASMLADVVEDAEVKTGRRSEGLLMSAENMFWKMVSGVGVFISGLMLAVIAFPAHAQRGSVAPEVLRDLALIYVPSILAIYVLTIACMWFYRIDRARHEANLATLAAAPQLAAIAAESEPAAP